MKRQVKNQSDILTDLFTTYTIDLEKLDTITLPSDAWRLIYMMESHSWTIEQFSHKAKVSYDFSSHFLQGLLELKIVIQSAAEYIKNEAVELIEPVVDNFSDDFQDIAQIEFAESSEITEFDFDDELVKETSNPTSDSVDTDITVIEGLEEQVTVSFD